MASPYSIDPGAAGSSADREATRMAARNERRRQHDDRQQPNDGGNIDHVVIAASGVWIVDAKNWEGRVERRWVG